MTMHDTFVSFYKNSGEASCKRNELDLVLAGAKGNFFYKIIWNAAFDVLRESIEGFLVLRVARIRSKLKDGSNKQTVNIPSEVQRHGGRAIKSLLDVLASTKDTRYTPLLKSLRMFITDLGENDAYLAKCVDQVDQVLNKGALTIVHPQAYPFFEMLIQTLNQQLNLDRLKIHGSRFVTPHATHFLFNVHFTVLLKEFEKSCQACYPAIVPSIVSKVLEMILSKILQAYSGRVIGNFNFQEKASASTLAFRLQLQVNTLMTSKTVPDGDSRKEEDGIKEVSEETILKVENDLKRREEEFDDELNGLLDQLGY